MKKFLIMFFFLILLLCSCDKKEYKLIELNGEEFLNHFSKENMDLVIAFYNDDLDNSDAFLEDLSTVAKRAKINVYYIDVNHIDMMNLLILDSALETETFDSLKYFVYQGGKIIVNEEYTDFDTMYKNLNGKRYEDVELMPDDTKQAYVDDAKELFDEGYISEAYNLLLKAWNYDETKNFVDDNEMFKIFNSTWEYQEVYDNNQINYIAMAFLSLDDSMLMIDQTFDRNEFVKDEITFDNPYYFKLNDETLCISKKIDSECFAEYEIISISDNLLRMKKDEKEYKFTVVKEVG